MTKSRWVRFRQILLLPYYGIQWFRVLGYRDKEQWKQVARILTELHRQVDATDDSHFWLGTALTHEGRWEEALVEFESIRFPLSDGKEDRSRVINHALSLYQTGRAREAVVLLRDEIDDRWEGAQLEKAKTLIAEAEART